MGPASITLTSRWRKLYSTASYLAHDLTGIGLGGKDLTGGKLRWSKPFQRNLVWNQSDRRGLTGAKVRGAQFGYSGITPAQLAATASFLAHDLAGIGLSGNDLSGANFAGQDLSSADFYFTNLTGADLSHANLTNVYAYGATLSGADLSAADTRGAQYSDLSAAVAHNTIMPEGHIQGLDLDGGRTLAVRDYDGSPAFGLGPIPIQVDELLVMGPGGILQMLFDADDWDSLISFAPGIPVTLGGTLELRFAAGVDLVSQFGRTIKLFDWSGVAPSGTFVVSSPYSWDLTNLYTSGQIRLVPEPSTFAFAALGLFGLLACGRRRAGAFREPTR